MKTHHLDTSIVIPYISGLYGTDEQRNNENNKKAVAFIKNCRAHVKISIVVVAEVLSKAANPEIMADYLDKEFPAPLPLEISIARRWARLQTRSGRTMGDNDAWVAALAYAKDAVVVGNDDDAFLDRPGLEYKNFARQGSP